MAAILTITLAYAGWDVFLHERMPVRLVVAALISDDGPGSDLFDLYETGWWKSISSDESAPADQPCPNCNGEGYVVVRVYPWDGYSYDEKPCDLCNPKSDVHNFED